MKLNYLCNGVAKMQQIVFASTNRGKYEEFKKSFAELPIEFLFAGDFDSKKKKLTWKKPAQATKRTQS